MEEVLLKHFGGKQHNKHMPLTARDRLGGRIVVTTVRNPWDFYLSLWSFNCMGEGGNFIRATKKTDFFAPINDLRLSWIPASIRVRHAWDHIRSEIVRDENFYKHVFSDSSKPELFQEWLSRTFDQTARFEQFPDYGYLNIGAGLMTYLHLLLCCGDVRKVFTVPGLDNYKSLRRFYQRYVTLDQVLKIETLGPDLIKALRFAGHEVSDSLELSILTREVTNRSRKGLAIADAYTPQLLQQVAIADRLIIETYGYQSGMPAAANRA